jgi:tetratricopeptide (TPR) repeat protein
MNVKQRRGLGLNSIVLVTVAAAVLASCNKSTMRKGAEDLYNQGRYRESAFHYQRLYKQHPSDAIATKLASSFIKSQKYQEAQLFIKKALEKEHDLSELSMEYADLLQHLGEYDSAISWYKKQEEADSTTKRTVQHKLAWCKIRKTQTPNCFSSEAKRHCVSLDASASLDVENKDLEYNWEFDDGKTEQGMVVSHCFDNGGNHNVLLHVTDPKTKTTDVKELDIPISFTSPFEVIKERNIYAKKVASFSIPPDQLGEASQVYWEFGDTQLGEGALVNHVYAAPGSYTLKVYLLDDNQQIIKCNEITVRIFNEV